MMKTRVLLFLAGIAFFASCGCNKARELPDVTPVPLPRYNTGLSMSSDLLNRVVTYDILLPEGYNEDTDKRYPVIYCFHGYDDNNTSWNGKYIGCEAKIKSLEAAGLEPMIYVFPYGWNTYWVDRYNGKYPYMTMLVNEFVPMIDRTYRTIADREHRGTIGYSMGGFGAMATAMQHPDVFSMSAPLSMSFRTDEQYMAESQSGWDNQWGRVFGGEGESGEARLTEYYKSLCPLHQFTAENTEKYSSVHWFLTCGDDEQQLLIANDDLHVLMRQNGYAHQYRVGNGGHQASYWKAALTEILPYFSALMAGETSWQMNLKDVQVPEGFNLNDDGVFATDAYNNAATKEGVAIYIFYNDVSLDWVKDGMAILQRGMNAKKLVLIPCDLKKKSVSEWVQYYKDLYPATYLQALAIGNAGSPVIKTQDIFSSLYFENADIPEDVTISKDKYYYIGQCDDSPYYKGANALYKACKLGGASFEYRCRNHLDEQQTDFLTGIVYAKEQLNNI